MSTPTMVLTSSLSASEMSPRARSVGALAQHWQAALAASARTYPARKVHDGGAILVEEVGPLGAEGVDLLGRQCGPLGVRLHELLGMLVVVCLVRCREVLGLATASARWSGASE